MLLVLKQFEQMGAVVECFSFSNNMNNWDENRDEM